MMMFMFWMTGNSLSIFTIMFTVSYAMKPVSAIFAVNSAFEPFERKELNLTLHKLAYIACNMVTIGLAAYKFGNMGILPVLPADWAGLLNPRMPIESNVVLLD